MIFDRDQTADYYSSRQGKKEHGIQLALAAGAVALAFPSNRKLLASRIGSWAEGLSGAKYLQRSAAGDMAFGISKFFGDHSEAGRMGDQAHNFLKQVQASHAWRKAVTDETSGFHMVSRVFDKTLTDDQFDIISKHLPTIGASTKDASDEVWFRRLQPIFQEEPFRAANQAYEALTTEEQGTFRAQLAQLGRSFHGAGKTQLAPISNRFFGQLRDAYLAQGAQHFSMETTWAERLFGLKRVSIQDFLSKERSRLSLGSHRQFRDTEAALSDFFGDLSKYSVGPGIYRTAEGEIVNYGNIGAAITGPRSWMDRNFEIPVAPFLFGLSPTRALPWIPREREKAVQTFFNMARQAYPSLRGEAGASQPHLAVGGKLFEVGADGTLSLVKDNVRTVEAHGYWRRWMESLTAKKPEGRRKIFGVDTVSESALSPQADTSAIRRLISIVTKYGDPNYPETALKGLIDFARGGVASPGDINKQLRVIVDTISANTVDQPHLYDEFISKNLPAGVAHVLRRKNPAVLKLIDSAHAGLRAADRERVLAGLGEAIVKGNIERKSSEEYQLFQKLEDFYRGRLSGRTRRERKPALLGALVDNMNDVDVPEEMALYQELGQYALSRSLTPRKKYRPTLWGAQEVLRGVEDPSKRALIQSTLIREFLGRGLEIDDRTIVPMVGGAERRMVQTIFDDPTGIFHQGKDIQQTVLGNKWARRLQPGPEPEGWKSSEAVILGRSIPLPTNAEGIPLIYDALKAFFTRDLKFSDPEWRQSFFEAHKNFLLQFSPLAGRGHEEIFTQASAPLHYSAERLSRLATTVGLGLNPADMGSFYDTWKNITLKRVLPISAGVFYTKYLNEKAEEAGLPNYQDLAEAKADVSMGVARVRQKLGIQRKSKWAKDALPGFELLQELPGLSGLIDDRTPEEFAKYVKEGYDPVRGGRYWFSGSRTPFQGGRIRTWVPNWYRRVAADIDETGVRLTPDQYYSSSLFPTPDHPTSILRWLRGEDTFFDVHQEDRPYPVSSPLVSPYSVFGGVINATLGRVLKPQEYHPYYDPKTGMDTREIEAARRVAYVSQHHRSPSELVQKVRRALLPLQGGGGGSGGGGGYGGGGGSGGGYGGRGEDQGPTVGAMPDKAGFFLGDASVGPDIGVTDNIAMERVGLHVAPARSTFYSTPSGRYQVFDGVDPSYLRAGDKPGALFAKRIRLDRESEPLPKELLHPGQLSYQMSIQQDVWKDILGIYGFAGATVREKLGLGDKTTDRWVLDDPSKAISPSAVFWNQEYGSLPTEELGSEVFRRFLPKPSGLQRTWNPIRNKMPEFMPGRCFVAGTPVLTDQGLVPIDQIEAGDKVYTHLGNLRSVVVQAEHWYEGELTHVKARGLPETITSTSSHHYWVTRSGACHYRPSRWCIPGRHPNKSNPCLYCKHVQHREPEWAEAGTLRPGDFLMMPLPKAEVIDEVKIEEIPNRGRMKLDTYQLPLDEVTGAVVGFFLAEGHAAKYVLTFGSGKEEPEQREHLDEFAKRLGRRTSHRPVYHEDGTGCIVSNLRSRELVEWFREWFGTSSHSKRVPDWCYGAPEEFRVFLVAAYLEGDGCLESKGGMSASSVSPDLILGIHNLLALSGIVSTIDCHLRNEGMRWNLRIPANEGRLLRELSSGYGRKISRIPDVTCSGSASQIHEGYILRRITSVNTTSAACPVYNLQVEEDETYNVWGVAVHNSYFTDFLHGDPFGAVPFGEYLVPGPAYEKVMGSVDTSLGHPSSSKIGYSKDQWVNALLRIGPDNESDRDSDRILDTGNAIHAAVQEIYQRQGRLLGAEVPVEVDGIEGYVDAIIRQGLNQIIPVEIKSTGTEKLAALRQYGTSAAGVPEYEKHEHQLNFYLHALNKKRGAIYYINREDYSDTLVKWVNYSPHMLKEDIATLREAQAEVKTKLDEGDVSMEQLYSGFERYKVLSLTAPYSENYREAKQALRNKHSSGDLAQEQWESYKELEGMVRERKERARLFPYRYRNQDRQERTAKIDKILGPGTFTIRGSEEIYRLSGFSHGGLSRKDREVINETAEEAGLRRGAKVRLVGGDAPSADTYKTRRVSVWAGGTNINRAVIDTGRVETNETGSTADTDIFHENNAVFGKLWERFCLIKGEPILTDRGIHSIEEVEPGDQVLTEEGSWRKVLRRCERVIDSSETVVHITAVGNNLGITLTDNHHVLAAKAKVCGACRYSPEHGDRGICNPTRKACSDCSPYIIDYYPVSELESRDFLVSAIDSFDRPSPGHSEDFYRLCGYYLAKGHIKLKNGRPINVCFAFHTEEVDLIQDVVDITKKEFGLDAHVYPDKNCSGTTVWITNAEVARKLYHLLGRCDGKFISQELLSNKAPLIELVRGFFLGDGCREEKRWSAAGTIPNVILGIRSILLHLGIVPSLHHQPPKVGGDGVPRKARYQLSVMGRYFRRFCELLGEGIPQVSKECASLSFIQDGKAFFSIKEISPVDYEGMVYDLEVEDVHSYSTPYYTIHNSHLDTPLATKFLKVRSPSEEWERGYIYGANYGAWQSPIRDYIHPIGWSLMGKDPISATLRGAAIGAAFTPKLEKLLIQQAYNAAKAEATAPLERLAKFVTEYAMGSTTRGKIGPISGGKVGALIGLGLSLYRMIKEGGSPNQGDAYIPETNRRKFEIEEYFDKLKFVKHSMLAREYDKLALEFEDRSIRKLLAGGFVRGGEIKSESRDLLQRKTEIYRELDVQAEELAGSRREEKAIAKRRAELNKEVDRINRRLSKLTGVGTAVRMGPYGTKALLHRLEANVTAYGADPENYSEVAGAIPNYARDVLLAGAENEYDRNRIWKTLPEWLRAPLHTMYGKPSQENPSLEDYFSNHSLPGPEWEGWRPGQSIDDVRSLAVMDESGHINPLEMGVWPQVSRSATERLGDSFSMPVINTANRHGAVEHRLRRLLNSQGLNIKELIFAPGAGAVEMDMLYNQDSQVMARL